MPLNGPGDAYSLAYIINRDFFSWAWADHPSSLPAGEGPEPRAWQNPTNISVNVSALPTDEANLVQQALALWHEVANINFSYTTGTANITYTDSASDPQGAHATTTTSLDAFGDRWITSATVNVPRGWHTGIGTGIADGVNSSYFQTLIHETGHALGLGHSGHYDGGGSPNFKYNTTDTIWANDTWQWSQMSYNDQTQYDGGTLLAVITPQIADIYAMQAKYGVASTRTGDTVYGFHSNAGPVYDFTGLSAPSSLTIYDSGGTDTLDCSGYAVAQTIDLRGAGFLPGEAGFSSIGGAVHNVSIYYTSVIENAVGGSGADTIYGNAAANTIDGGGGTDTMAGGAGDDIYLVDSVFDTVNENAGEGYDYVKCTATSYTLGANVERLNYLGNSTANFSGYGNALDNWITGWNGNDHLDGGAGADTLEGFAGNDTYVVDNFADVITESANAGYDDVLCYATSYTLGANVEKLNYIGNNTADFTGIGNAGDNLIIGWSGNDYLDGAAGADTMQGLSGNDAYTVDNVGDVVEENANAGIDRVRCLITSYTLGANVEDLNYLGTPTLNFTGTGNSLDNHIIGWNGNDYLDGGLGADTFEGFAGNDTFIVDNAGDVIIENANNGIDIVITSLSNYVLAVNVENLTFAGAGSSVGTGNSSDNVIDGGAGGDSLYGGLGSDVLYGGTEVDYLNGGVGGDTLYGQDGNDTLDGGADADYLGGGLGADSMYGGSGNDVMQGGDNADYLDGNSGADTMYGDAGDDVLDGGADLSSDADYIDGGDGNDTLYGRGGNDSMIGGNGFDALYGDDGADYIFGGEGNDYLGGQNGGDFMQAGNGDDSMNGGTGADYMEGNNGADSIYAGDGNDMIHGGTGNDYVNGQNGSDTIYGEEGNDVLDGGNDSSDDYLDGGALGDAYIFGAGMGHDVIGTFDDVGGGGFEDYIYIDHNIVANFGMLSPAMSQNGANVIINLGGYGGIQIDNVILANLGADDFLFY